MAEDKGIIEQAEAGNQVNPAEISPEEQRKLAAGFYKQHQEIINLARIYSDNPMYSPYHPTVRTNKYTHPFMAYFESIEELPIDYRLRNVRIGLADYGKDTAEHADKVGINTSVRLEIPLYTDLETTEAYRRYVLDGDNFALDNLLSIYYYNEQGDFQKIQQTDIEFDSGNKDLYRKVVAPGDKIIHKGSGYPGEEHGFKCDISTADFAIVETSLRLAKAGFIERLRQVAPGLVPKIDPESATKTVKAS